MRAYCAHIPRGKPEILLPLSLLFVFPSSQDYAIICILLIMDAVKRLFSSVGIYIATIRHKMLRNGVNIKSFKSAGGFFTLLSTRRPPLKDNLRAGILAFSIHKDGWRGFNPYHPFFVLAFFILTKS
jgi:hypothetical protein